MCLEGNDENNDDGVCKRIVFFSWLSTELNLSLARACWGPLLSPLLLLLLLLPPPFAACFPKVMYSHLSLFVPFPFCSYPATHFPLPVFCPLPFSLSSLFATLFSVLRACPCCLEAPPCPLILAFFCDLPPAPHVGGFFGFLLWGALYPMSNFFLFCLIEEMFHSAFARGPWCLPLWMTPLQGHSIFPY